MSANPISRSIGRRSHLHSFLSSVAAFSPCMMIPAPAQLHRLCTIDATAVEDVEGTAGSKNINASYLENCPLCLALCPLDGGFYYEAAKDAFMG